LARILYRGYPAMMSCPQEATISSAAMPRNGIAMSGNFPGCVTADIYPATDLIYYGNQRQLEYDFSLRPGADPKRIRLRIEGTSEVRLDQSDLVLVCSTGEIRLIGRTSINIRRRKEIRGDYVLKRNGALGACTRLYQNVQTLRPSHRSVGKTRRFFPHTLRFGP
jgi:hypothetical protein